CANCGTPLQTIGTASQEPSTPSASLQVGGLARSLLGEQRKVVTVLFADLSGSTPLAERLDPEELRGILASYFGALARQIQRYEGTIDKYIGAAVMAVFGTPGSRCRRRSRASTTTWIAATASDSPSASVSTPARWSPGCSRATCNPRTR